MPATTPHTPTDDLLATASAALKTTCATPTAMQTHVQHLLTLYRQLGQPPHAAHPRTRSMQDALLQACEKLEQDMQAPGPGATDDPASTTTAQNAVAAPTAADAASDSAVAWETLRDTGVTFADVVGASDAIQAIREAMVLPFRFPDLYARLRLRPWRSILLYGPPGTGKSLLARAAAHEIEAVFFSVSCADVTSKWVGGSEKLIKVLFADAAARSPAIVFFDEIDSIARARRSDTNVADQRLTNQLLLEMDRVAEASGAINVSVLAATNLPWELDTAVLRRFAKQILVDTPSEAERRALLALLFEKHGVVFEREAMQEFALQTAGFSGSDLANLVHESAYAPLRVLLGATRFEVVEGGEDGDGCMVKVRVVEDGEMSDAAFDARVEEVLEEYGEAQVEVPVLSVEMVRRAVRSRQASVAQDVQYRYRDYARGLLASG